MPFTTIDRARRRRTTWLLVVAFAAGMAWVEAAAVYYIRTLVDRVEPYQVNPLPIHGALGPVELWREAATLVMLLTVGMLAARGWRRRVGYSAIAFGVWDIFYYLFLRVISGWPTSLFDWDVLFLLPLPWWGPVLAPLSIAVLMIGWGTMVTQSRDRHVVSMPWIAWGSSATGIALALYVFMADSLRSVRSGLEAITQVLPISFQWPVFCLALTLMAAPVAHIAWRLRPWLQPAARDAAAV